jgi:LCP family protein required for cell wall assembly
MRTTLKRGVSGGALNGSANGAPPVPPIAMTPVTRYGPPRRGALHLLGRILLSFIVFVLVAAGGLAGGVWLWWEHSVAATAPKTAEERAAQAALDAVPAPDQPAISLVIGYDLRPSKGKERTGINESRSDTILLIRADPKLRTISMLSFPRDLRVELSGCKDVGPRVAKINEAFTDCGPKGTLQTVRNLTGIPINYLITVDFRSFVDIVNQLGGVYMDVDRRYFNDNEGLGSAAYSAIDVQPGYQRLSGPDALAYVRYRHTDSDLYRNARQQEFVKAVKQQVSGLSAAWKLRGIVNAITSNVTVGVGGGGELQPETVLSYAKLAYELPNGNFFQSRLDTLSENSFTFELSASEEEVQEAVDAFMNPDPEAAEKATSVAIGEKPKSKTKTGPPASQVNVEVLNGNGVAGAAGDAVYLLGQRGYKAMDGGNAETFEYFQTLIVYDPARAGAEGAARDMAKLFGDAEVREGAPDEGLETMLRITLGKTFQGTLAPVPKDTTPTRQPPRVVQAREEALPLLRVAQRRVDFPLMVPTMRESSSQLSDLVPIRAYDVRAGEKAVRLVYNGPFGTDYWGIQMTSWTDAPVLEGPTVRRRLGGREYSLYFNGNKLHMVAFIEDGGAYWVVNTLLDAMSNETMLAIAKGLKPLRR